MTLLLKTESHVEVESGFYRTFTQFARLGEHTFATRHLCELIQHLAEYPQVSQTQIISYDLDKFLQRLEDYAQELTQIKTEAEQSYLPNLQKYEIIGKLGRKQNKISLENELDLYNEGKIIPVIVTDDEKAISIGEYKIS